MATTTEAFAIAVKQLRAGQFQTAEQICLGIVEADPACRNSTHTRRDSRTDR